MLPDIDQPKLPPLRTTYKHPHIDRQNEQFRLVTLSDRDGQIECNLEVFKLEDAPKYTALSYLWGPETPTSEIRVNGRPFSIRENLYLFLQEILKAKNSTCQHLWMDQICIAQDDVQEKNHQVRLMSSIYKKAESVLVWLGKPTDKRRELARRFFEIWIRRTEEFEDFDRLIPGGSSSSDIAAIEALLEEDYCQRVWVKQEVLLNNEVNILISADYELIPWLLVQAIMAAKSKTRKLDTRLDVAWGLASRSPNTFPEDLYVCLILLGKSQCSDPRDMVYGLLSLCHEMQRPEIDYNKCCEQVYLDAVLVMWRTAILKSRQHTASCGRVPRVWSRFQAACERIDINMTGSDPFSVRAFSKRLARWGLERREEIITEMGYEVDQDHFTESHLHPDILTPSGRWWFQAGGKIHWHDGDEEVNEETKKSLMLPPEYTGETIESGFKLASVQIPDIDTYTSAKLDQVNASCKCWKE